MVTWIALTSLIFQPLFSLGQSRETQNIYRVKVNSRYVIEDGKRTVKYLAIGQEISDSLGRLHTEIFYDWETRKPNNFKWNYFEGKRKYKTDFFKNEKLARVEEYYYQNDSLLNRIVVKVVTENDTIFLVRVDYTYSANGLVSKAVGYNERGKKGHTTTYIYNSFGTEIERKVKGKRTFPPDSILYLKRTPNYDSQGRIIQEDLIIDKVGKCRVAQKYEYSYDDKGNLTVEIKYNDKGTVEYRKVYEYRKDKRIKMVNVYNSNQELVDCLAWRYEIYKTDNRRQRVYE
jgi:hypothetical protein